MNADRLASRDGVLALPVLGLVVSLAERSSGAGMAIEGPPHTPSGVMTPPVRLDEVVLAAVREGRAAARQCLDRRHAVGRRDRVRGPLGLQQVLVNVLDNALEVSPANSEVTVALSTSSDAVHVTVSDARPGVPPGERERIFDPFYSHKPAGCAHAGAGLGLAIARSIAREHGGELAARGRPGAGATFELSLPWSPGSPHATPPDNSQDQALAAGRRTTNRAPASLG